MMYMTNGKTRLSIWVVQASTREVTVVAPITPNQDKREESPNRPVRKIFYEFYLFSF